MKAKTIPYTLCIVALCALAGCNKPEEQASSASAKEASKALATRFFSEVWNPPFRMETIDELPIEDFAGTTDGKDLRGRESFKKWVQGLQSKVDDLQVETQDRRF